MKPIFVHTEYALLSFVSHSSAHKIMRHFSKHHYLLLTNSHTSGMLVCLHVQAKSQNKIFFEERDWMVWNIEFRNEAGFRSVLNGKIGFRDLFWQKLLRKRNPYIPWTIFGGFSQVRLDRQFKSVFLDIFFGRAYLKGQIWQCWTCWNPAYSASMALPSIVSFLGDPEIFADFPNLRLLVRSRVFNQNLMRSWFRGTHFSL